MQTYALWIAALGLGLRVKRGTHFTLLGQNLYHDFLYHLVRS